MSVSLVCLKKALAIVLFGCSLWISTSHAKTIRKPPYEAEARLITIYKLMGEGRSREALPLAEQLTKNFPDFQLGHLVYGDLLNLHAKVVNNLGDLPPSMVTKNNLIALMELREESLQRIKALQERPLMGTIPNQIIGLALRNKNVIAVDASKSRLYVFENSVQGLKLVADFYVSVGKAGTGKYVQGDFKTPLGIYYLTTPINPKLLAPLYGGGALPINYPNPFDLRLGKSGGGIWLHGTMPGRYSRQVNATDGCVVLANPDLQTLMHAVSVKTTPVIIASKLQWVAPKELTAERQQFEASLNAWRSAKNNAQLDRLYSFYMSDFNNYGKNLTAWWPSVIQEVKTANKHVFQWQEVTTLLWRTPVSDKTPNVMVVTYDEIVPSIRHAITKRQYWMQVGHEWKIFFEGTLAS